MLLSDIAHIGGAPDCNTGHRDRALRDRLATAPLHRGIDGFHGLAGNEASASGVNQVLTKSCPQVGNQHAVRGEVAGRARDDGAGDAQFARQHGGVQRPAPP